jgi:glycosyltransferase involved in cell wall biosynthesis
LKIAIIGTRGIPNHYSGFEQFAEFFAVYAADNGYDITVYNSHNHLYKEEEFKGVKIRHKFDPEYLVGTFGQFIYDFNCIMDARSQNFDIILQLGYTSSSIWHFLMPKKAKVLTNMDGLEWKRTKYAPMVQKFLKFAEKLAAVNSDYLISDSIGIQEYIKSKYGLISKYIPYGADLVTNIEDEVLAEYNLKPLSYNMLIARMEPENNIEVILDGVVLSNQNTLFLVVGNYKKTKFGNYLYKKFGDNQNIKFTGGIFNINKLNALRNYSNLYFHGHSVGGTNPSLLEAMASNTVIIAHNNPFNKSILEKDAFYFENANDVAKYLKEINKMDYLQFANQNKLKIENYFRWDGINQMYLDLMSKAHEKD